MHFQGNFRRFCILFILWIFMVFPSYFGLFFMLFRPTFLLFWDNPKAIFLQFLHCLCSFASYFLCIFTMYACFCFSTSVVFWYYFQSIFIISSIGGTGYSSFLRRNLIGVRRNRLTRWRHRLLSWSHEKTAQEFH